MEIERNQQQGYRQTPWVPGGVKSYFLSHDELVNLVEPLVLALEWQGDYRQLVEALPHFSEGLDLTGFLNIMATIDYDSEKTHTSLNHIPYDYLPCLFIPDEGTAVVIKNSGEESYTIVDGETGEEREILKDDTKGTLYHFSRFDVDKAIVIKKSESLKEMFFRFRPLFTQILILTFLYNIFIATVPIYIMLVYDRVIPTESISLAFSFLIGILIFLFSSQLLAYARTKIIAYIGARLDKTIGESIIYHLLYLSPTYTESNTAGAQIARIRSFDNIRDFFTGQIALMVCEFPFAIIFLAIIFWLGGWLGFVPIILAMVFYGIYHIANPVVTRYIRIQSQQNVLKQTFLLESFQRQRDLKETGRTQQWDDKYDEMLVKLSKNGFDNAFYNSVLGVVSEAFMMLAALAMLVMGALTSMYEELSLGMLIAIMMLTWKVLNPLKSFFASLPKIEQISNSIAQVNKLFSIPIERGKDRDIVPTELRQSKIEFNRVTFKYKPELPPSILGVSFIIKPGELVCVTGKNSSGKSTLLRLILGLYKPQAGNILINDMNIQQFDPIELRHTIAYLPQNIQLFFGSIKQNIQLGNLVATEAEVQTAAMLAGVHEDIMRLSDQYNTKLGDHMSSEYSSTFLQKIILARTYVKKSSIMLFDEPANGFDDETDKSFVEVINYLRKESTIVWVTHRPSHLKVADKILYLEKGEVALYGKAAKGLERLPRSVI